MSDLENNNENKDTTKLAPQIIEEVSYCTKCGAKNPKGATICSSCGRLMNGKKADEKNNDTVRCPICGSSQVEFVTHQASQNLSGSNACCGYLLCGPLGLLFGLGPKTPAKTVRKCKNCGHEF